MISGAGSGAPLERRQGSAGGVHATQTMNACARRRGCRTEIHSLDRRCVWHTLHGGTKEELAQGVGAADDVSAHEIRVVLRELRRAVHAPRDDAVAKSRGEPL